MAAVYLVEAILDHELREDEMYYLVKWDGYDDPAENTWEPESSFTKPSDLLDAYKEKYQDGETESVDGVEEDEIEENEESCRVVKDGTAQQPSSSGYYCTIL